MATLNISLPDDLKARMDSAGANWSAIARRAFELHLNSTARTEGDMDAAIARLRASKQKIEEKERPEWTELGRKWAMDEAEYDELRRMAELGDLLDHDPRVYPEAIHLLDALYQAETGTDDDWRYTRDDLAERLTGEPGQLPSREQLCWYLDGVQHVWNEVADKL